MTPQGLRALADRLAARGPSSGESAALVPPEDAEALAAAARCLAAVQEAWTVPGPRPDIHEREKRELRRRWPTLASAIERAL